MNKKYIFIIVTMLFNIIGIALILYSYNIADNLWDLKVVSMYNTTIDTNEKIQFLNHTALNYKIFGTVFCLIGEIFLVKFLFCKE